MFQPPWQVAKHVHCGINCGQCCHATHIVSIIICGTIADATLTPKNQVTTHTWLLSGVSNNGLSQLVLEMPGLGQDCTISVLYQKILCNPIFNCQQLQSSLNGDFMKCFLFPIAAGENGSLLLLARELLLLLKDFFKIGMACIDYFNSHNKVISCCLESGSLY